MTTTQGLLNASRKRYHFAVHVYNIATISVAQVDHTEELEELCQSAKQLHGYDADSRYPCLPKLEGSFLRMLGTNFKPIRNLAPS
jgi:hypothetical protein